MEISADRPIDDASSRPPGMEANGLSWRLFRSVGGTFAASLGTFAFFAIQGILLARLLGPEGRGEFATIFAYPQLFLYMGLLGAAEIFARMRANVDSESGDPRVRRAALRYGLTTGIATGGLCIILAWFALPPEKQYLAPLAMLAAFSIPLQHVRFSVQGVDHGRGAFHRYNVVRITSAAMFPMLLLGMWMMGWNDLRDTTIAMLIACAAGALWCQWGMRGNWIGPSEQSVRQSLTQNRGLAISQIMAELLDRADLFLVLYIGSLTEQGFYTSAIPIAATMIILPNAIGLYTFRRAAGSIAPLAAREVTRLLGIIVMAQVVLSLVLAGIIPYLVPILYTRAFEPTVVFAWYLLPAAALRGLLMSLDGYMRGRGKPRSGIIGRVVAIVIVFAVTLSQYPTYGIWIIPIALGIGQLICVLFVTTAMYQESDP